MRARTWVLIAVLCVGAGNGAPLTAQQTDFADMPRQTSVELPSDLERVLREYEQHWSRGEAAELAALFVEHGLIIRGGQWIRGHEAIERAYQGASGPLRLRAIEFASDGDVGFIVGAYGYGDQLPVDDMGMFTLTLERRDGVWLIVSDMDRGA